MHDHSWSSVLWLPLQDMICSGGAFHAWAVMSPQYVRCVVVGLLGGHFARERIERG